MRHSPLGPLRAWNQFLTVRSLQPVIRASSFTLCGGRQIRRRAPRRSRARTSRHQALTVAPHHRETEKFAPSWTKTSPLARDTADLIQHSRATFSWQQRNGLRILIVRRRSGHGPRATSACPPIINATRPRIRRTRSTNMQRGAASTSYGPMPTRGAAGNNIAGRESLKSLIDDVRNGRTDFTAILVYDISRWGRFQDADESGYYDEQPPPGGHGLIVSASSPPPPIRRVGGSEAAPEAGNGGLAAPVPAGAGSPGCCAARTVL